MKKLILFAAIVALASCRKSDPEELPEKVVTFKVYSESGEFSFSCITSEGWYRENVKAHNYEKAVKVKDDQLQYVTQASTVFAPDSLHLSAECEGKKAEQGIRVLKCPSCSGATVSLQLTELR